ncbi:MAG: paraquat-inducible protein A [Opitutaceae bacterium]
MMTRAAYLRSNHLSRATALALAAAVMLVPANLLPVLSTNTGGSARTDTIMSGIINLWHEGMWAIAAIVFVASILIPLLKLAGLAWLLLAVKRRATGRRRGLTRLYAGLDFIGRWSMLDVFLVAFLAGAVPFGALALIEPRSGIVAFGSAVVLTILATDSFDPRLLWAEPGTATAAPLPSPAPSP